MTASHALSQLSYSPEKRNGFVTNSIIHVNAIFYNHPFSGHIVTGSPIHLE
jgi:hypothetical protein